VKRILKSLPFLFIFGLLLWVVNALVASMFIPGKLALDSTFFSTSLENIYARIMIVSFSILLYMILFRIFIYEKDQKLLRNAFNHSFPMCITDFDHNIIDANASYWKTFNQGEKTNEKTKCYDNRPGASCHTDACSLKRIQLGEKEVSGEQEKQVNGESRYYIIKAKPVINGVGDTIGFIESYDDITARKMLEQEKQRLIDELQSSLEQVKMLKGMLPLCPSCKQVRTDEGYWDQIESYLADNSEAEITHCLCPECKDQCHILLEDDSTGLLQSPEPVTRDMQWLKVANYQ
jgi:PAS domain S-box-containing protein